LIFFARKDKVEWHEELEDQQVAVDEFRVVRRSVTDLRDHVFLEAVPSDERPKGLGDPEFIRATRDHKRAELLLPVCPERGSRPSCKTLELILCEWLPRAEVLDEKVVSRALFSVVGHGLLLKEKKAIGSS
jgi:hypothetical protein